MTVSSVRELMKTELLLNIQRIPKIEEPLFFYFRMKINFFFEPILLK